MKKFLAIYIGTAATFEKSNWNARPEAQRRQIEQEGMRAWAEWGAKYQKSILVQGGPLGKTKRISSTGVSDIKNNMTGYVLVQAESHEAAARMFENHPHFAIFPGAAVEVMECTSIPGM